MVSVFKGLLFPEGFWRSLYSAGILEQPMGARNRQRIGLSYRPARARIFKPLRNSEIDAKESISPFYVACAGIFKQSMEAKEPSKNRAVEQARQSPNF